MADDLSILHQRIDTLEALLTAALGGAAGGGSPIGAARGPDPDHPERGGAVEVVGRRQLLGKLAAGAGAAVGAVALGIHEATPAAANPGQAVVQGQVNNAMATATTLNSTVGTATFVTNNTGAGNGLEGHATVADSSGLFATNPAGFGVFATGAQAGVVGQSDAANGTEGRATAAGVSGVYGVNPNGYGVAGDGSASHAGVLGRAPGGIGVDGAGATGVRGNGTDYGVLGQSDVAIGVLGQTPGGIGVYGESGAGAGAGVIGVNLVGGVGVVADSAAGKAVDAMSRTGSSAAVSARHNGDGPALTADVGSPASAVVATNGSTGVALEAVSNAGSAISAVTTTGTAPAITATHHANGTAITALSLMNAICIDATTSNGTTIKAMVSGGASANGHCLEAVNTGFGAGVFATARFNGVDATTQTAGHYGVLAKATGGGIPLRATTGHNTANATETALTGGSATGSALLATNAGPGPAVTATSTKGVGIKATGSLAPLLLTPKATVGAPTASAHARGELVVDSVGDLYLCTAPGTPGTWRKIAFV